VSKLTGFHRTGGIALLSSIIIVTFFMGGSTAFGQEGSGHAGVVVQFGDGRVLTRYLELSAPVDRLTALEATGLIFETAFGGDAVCKIEEEGCPGNDTDCWCQCPFTPGEPCTFWIYFPVNETGDEWGDMNTWPLPELEDGDVSGWVWGEVDVEASPWVPLVEPPFYTVDQIYERALIPGTVSATAGVRELSATASFSGDSDGSGSATLRYRSTGRTWSEPQAMVPGEPSFSFTIAGLEPGEYEVQVTYSDYESGVIGENGGTSFTASSLATQISAAEEAPGEAETEEPAEVPSPEGTTPPLSSHAGTVGIGALAFVAILGFLLIVYLRRRAY
jgi:hypothetical protein